jgi:hypothetical protein
MRLSISNFSLRLSVFVGVLIASVIFVEAYCRLSKRFNDFSFSYLRMIAEVDAGKAVFGDSHVGLTSYIPHYAFLGEPGQQPKELLLLVRSLYAHRRPERVIVEASPQWFGEYHVGRRPLLTSAALAPPKSLFGVHLLALSSPYSGALFNNLLADLQSALAATLTAAHASVPRPIPETFRRFAKEWEESASNSTFNWSQFPLEKRRVLTAGRVYEQNPIKGFEMSDPLHAFEDAIAFLIARGAEVCMFRTPVSADYLRIASQIADSRYAAFDIYIRAFAASKNLKFIDFRSLSFSFDDSKFMNADHLNSNAADAMWPLVADACFGS